MSMKHRPRAGMRTRAATFGALLAAAFALAAAGSLAAGAAPADAFYLNTSTDANPDNAHLNLLRFPPRNPGFRPCIHRTVRVPRGVYEHGGYVVHLRHRNDPDVDRIRISITVPGRYRWEACRGWTGNRFGNYEVRSTLRGPGGFHHSRVNIIEPYDPLGAPSHVGYGNGYYEWGGRIARHPCPTNDCTRPQD
jgi:hypothetical protein